VSGKCRECIDIVIYASYDGDNKMMLTFLTFLIILMISVGIFVPWIMGVLYIAMCTFIVVMAFSEN
jgi:hypothetical protein